MVRLPASPSLRATAGLRAAARLTVAGSCLAGLLAGSPADPSTVAADDVMHLEWSAQYGGNATVIAAAGDYLYLMRGARLVVATFRPPAPVTDLGETGVIAAGVQQLVVAGDHVYLAAGTAGLVVVDVAAPQAPRVASRLAPPDPEDTVVRLAVAGGLAWLVTRSLTDLVVDVTTPERPKLLATFRAGDDDRSYTAGVAWVDGYAWLCGQGGLAVVDARAPRRLSMVAERPDLRCTAMVVDEGRALLATDDGLRILATTDPTRPRDLAAVRGPNAAGLYLRGLVVDAGRAYGYGDADVWIWDIADPARAHLAGVHSTSPPGSPRDGIADLVADGGRLAVLLGSGTLRTAIVDDLAGLLPQGTMGVMDDYRSLAATGALAVTVDDRFRLRVLDLSRPRQPRAGPPFVPGDLTEGVWLNGTLAVTRLLDHGRGNGGLALVDLSTPAWPQLLGTLRVAWQPVAIAFGDGYLYAAAYDDGLHVVDVRDPRRPVEIVDAAIPGPVYDIVRSGNHLHAGLAGELAVLDLTDPAHPATVARYGTGRHSGWCRVSADGDLAVATCNSGMAVYDVSDAGRPVFLTDLTITLAAVGLAGGLPNDWQRAELAGSRLVVSKSRVGLAVIDLTDPWRPRVTGTYLDDAVGSAFARVGDTAYVTATTPGLHIVPLAPTAGTTELAGALDGPWTAGDVVADGDHAYVATEDHGLRVVDLRDPYQPGWVTDVWPTSQVSDVTLDGRRVYAAVPEQGLQVLDVTDPEHPSLVGAWAPPWNVMGVTVSAGRALVLGTGNNEAGESVDLTVQVLDVSDPTRPRWQGAADIDGWPQAVAVQGDLAAVATLDAGLVLVDVTDPAHPRRQGQLGGLPLPVDVALRDHHAYVADEHLGLVVVDVTEPRRPAIVSTTAVFSQHRALTLSWPLVWLIGAEGLRAVDVSDPAAPRVVGGLGERSARRMAVVGDKAVLALGAQGLETLDVRNVTHQLPFTDRPGDEGVRDLAVAGARSFIARGGAGLQVLEQPDASQPPVPVAALADEPAQAVAVAGGLAYVGAGLGGLRVLDVTAPGPPRPVARNSEVVDIRQVIVAGDRAYVREGLGAGVSVLDLASPDQITYLGGINLDASRLALLGDSGQALVVTTDGALHRVDLRDPATGVLDHLVPGIDTAIDVAAGDRYAWVLREAGLAVGLDFRDLDHPIQVVEIPDTSGAERITLRDNRLLIAFRGCALKILDVRLPANPRLVARADRQPACPQQVQNLTAVAPAGTGVLLGTRDSGLWYAGPAQATVSALYLPSAWR